MCSSDLESSETVWGWGTEGAVRAPLGPGCLRAAAVAGEGPERVGRRGAHRLADKGNPKRLLLHFTTSSFFALRCCAALC